MVTIMGRPRDGLAQKFWRYAQVREGCWPWLGSLHNGYGQIHHKGRYEGAHRVSAHLHLGFDLRDPCYVCHHCDTPACVNPAHLFVGTATDNNRDAISKGRARRVGTSNPGEANPSAKLEEHEVCEIRQLAAAGCPYTEIALQYGVTRTNIYKIATWRTWAHV